MNYDPIRALKLRSEELRNTIERHQDLLARGAERHLGAIQRAEEELHSIDLAVKALTTKGESPKDAWAAYARLYESRAARKHDAP